MRYLLPGAAVIVALVLIAMVLVGAIQRGPGLLSDPARSGERRQLRQLACC